MIAEARRVTATLGAVADLGRAALIVAFGLALYAAVAGGLAAYGERRRLHESARNALVGVFAATAVAALVLLNAFRTRDFSFTYVAEHSSRKLPFPYSFTAFWALVLAFVASPFARQVAPADGSGLTPSLQNAYMVIHPPLLYLGYVGMTIPFAFAAGALLSGRTDERWIVATRRWTLAAWAFLGIGQLLGAHWAYVEVGWGGYYAWDPVENAALMPWLAATAFLHSVMIQERRGMLKDWNMLLVVLAFCLALFGTFLTRSGVVSSIHSFTQSPLGPWFLGFICLITAASLALVFLRLPLLRSKTRLESLVSREATFLYNNLLLVALALTILWGVMYPILSEVVTGQAATVSKPYYNFFLHTFGIPLLLLMGIGPLVAWRRASLRALGRTFLWPLAAAVIAGVALLAAGAGSSRIGVIAYTFSVFVLASIVLEFVRGTIARKALGGLGWAGAFSSLVARNRRRYGGYVVHASIVLLAIGVTGASAYQTVRESRLNPGQSITVAGDRLVFRGFQTRMESNHRAIRALVDVYRGDKYLGRYRPGKNQYFAEDQVSNEVAIRHDLLTGGDLFLIADQVNSDGSIDLKALQKPLVNLLWFAGFVFVGGALIALWPDAREERRLAARYAGATVRA